MDLALELGMTVRQLKATMLSSELADWYAYVRKKPLPTQRLAYQIARVAQSLGGGSLDDHILFEHREPEPMAAEDGASALAAIAGGPGVHVLGKKRRKKAS